MKWPPRSSTRTSENGTESLQPRRPSADSTTAPGSILELDETPEAGVAREVMEETGIHVEVDKLTGVYKNMTRGVVALVFRASPPAA